jgi:hypothetical protein
MNARQFLKAIKPCLVSAAMYLAALGTVQAQVAGFAEENTIHGSGAPAAGICEETALPSPLKDALRMACLRQRAAMADVTVPNPIIIGFVGGFVKHDDPKHPEVQFAAYLRERYPSAIHAEVFSNHQGQEALRRVLQLLDTDGDGAVTTVEKERASIIIYGHSWGASQTVTFARELERHGVPVRLTVQVDSIAKPGQHDSMIPANVESAVNFYQSRGLLHGRPTILAADPSRTKILGNYWMTYPDHRINCDNYRWLVRVFNKPHHEIENDPRVWDKVASLIDSELLSANSTTQAVSASQ